MSFEQNWCSCFQKTKYKRIPIYFPGFFLHWKSTTFNCLWRHLAYSFPMRTNINFIMRFKYIYYCKIYWKVQTYITNLTGTFLLKSYLLLNIFLFYKKYFFAEANLKHVNMAVPCSIFLTKKVFNGFKVSIHKYVIKINIVTDIRIEI